MTLAKFHFNLNFSAEKPKTLHRKKRIKVKSWGIIDIRGVVNVMQRYSEIGVQKLIPCVPGIISFINKDIEPHFFPLWLCPHLFKVNYLPKLFTPLFWCRYLWIVFIKVRIPGTHSRHFWLKPLYLFFFGSRDQV
jgi:hypothetical protein